MTSASDEGILLDVHDRVAYVTIDRQARRNALSQAAMERIVTLFDRFDGDNEVWLVLVTGAGEQAFCAGRDLKDIAERDRQGLGTHVPMQGPMRNVFEVVWECRKPVVAAVNGWAMGAGMELALACDLRIAAEGARFGMPESKRGMGANFGSVVLPRLVPAAIANEILYFGESFSAAQALAWGLVNRVVPDGALAGATEGWVRALLERAPLTLRRYKSLARRSLELPVAAALRLDPAPDPYTSEDRVEGVAAFAEKRTPVWCAR